MQLQEEYSDRIAVITGGAVGIGRAFGVALAERGAHTVLVDIDGKTAEETAKLINSGPGKASSFQCDICDETAVQILMESTIRDFGGIDILINNAGLHSDEYNQPMSSLGISKLQRLFDVNVMGTIICTLAAAEAMSKRKGATIINISSTAAMGCYTAYGVSKLAVKGLTATFAHELGPKGIRVNAIAPGLIFTDTIKDELPEDLANYVIGQQIIKREGIEADIVNMMLYLSSEKSSFVTGETYRVSGGFAANVC